MNASPIVHSTLTTLQSVFPLLEGNLKSGLVPSIGGFLPNTQGVGVICRLARGSLADGLEKQFAARPTWPKDSKNEARNRKPKYPMGTSRAANYKNGKIYIRNNINNNNNNSNE